MAGQRACGGPAPIEFVPVPVPVPSPAESVACLANQKSRVGPRVHVWFPVGFKAIVNLLQMALDSPVTDAKVAADFFVAVSLGQI